MAGQGVHLGSDEIAYGHAELLRCTEHAGPPFQRLRAHHSNIVAHNN